MATGNAINLNTAGVVTYSGTGTFTGSAVTQYDVLVGGASNAISSVGPGSAGQILRSGGNAANPAYSTATYPSTAGTSGNVLTSDGTNWNSSAPAIPTGGRTLISSQTASASTSILFTSGITGYQYYQIEWYEIVAATNATQIQLQISTDGGSTYIATNYTNGGVVGDSTPQVVTSSAITTAVALSGTILSNTAYGMNGFVECYGLTNTALRKNFIVTSNYVTSTGTLSSTMRSTCWSTTTAAVNAIKFFITGSNITSGTVRLFGIS